MVSRTQISVLAALLGMATAARAGEFQVELTVEEPAGVARTAEPVSGGVPLPAGTFKKDQAFAVFKGGGEIASQVLPLVLDDKGFLRWVLVDFQDEFGAKAKNKYVLRAAKGSAKPASPLKVTEGDGVTVDTGKIKFTVSKSQPFGLFSSVEAGGAPVAAGGEVSYTEFFTGGKKFVADKPSSVVVEYGGPMRATVCVKGRFAGDEGTKAQYIARITAWAGKSRVHVKYSLSNSNPDHYCYRALADSSIALNLAAKSGGGAVLGAREPIDTGGEDGWLASALRSGTAGASKAGSGGKATWTSTGRGDEPEGWIAAKGSVYVCDLYFAEDPARKLEVAGNKLVLHGAIERWRSGQKDKKGREVGRPYESTKRWWHDSTHLSSEYYMDFAPPAAGPALSSAAKAARNRLWILCPPAWYFDTAALHVGRFGTQEDEFKCYDAWGWKYEKLRAPKEPARRHGRYKGTEDNHFETEQDSLDVLAIMYLRTGCRSYFDAARTWANYNMDIQAWRTDGWRYKDGGVWWRTGPHGNRPQRGADPASGYRNSTPAGWSKKLKEPWDKELASDAYVKVNSKSCYCHNWGEGLTVWYCLTGNRDALETAVDRMEQDYDTERRAFKKSPGKAIYYSRDFNRAWYVANAVRFILPEDKLAIEASDYLAAVYVKRPVREPRGLVNARYIHWAATNLKKLVGPGGVKAGEEAGVTFNNKTAIVTETKTGKKWHAIPKPNTFMYPPLSRAKGLYHRITGTDDAMDETIAYGQAAARVLWQPDHGQQHGGMLADWPRKGVVRDYASWNLPAGSKLGKGVRISGYLARFHPDIPARAYALTGESFLKKRAYDYWNSGSHRGYQAPETKGLGSVGRWVNWYGPHAETVCFTGRTFYIWSHPRKDGEPPAAVKDLKVTVAGEGATVTFTAPADAGGGKVMRYQVKCSDKPIVDYVKYLEMFNRAKDEEANRTNWWMAANLDGEPAPKAPGARESFTVSGVPAGAKHFAVRSFDDSSNRSAMSNLTGQ